MFTFSYHFAIQHPLNLLKIFATISALPKAFTNEATAQIRLIDMGIGK
jgi:hypothetical protein